MITCMAALPKGCWLGDLTRSHPDVKGHVLSFTTVINGDKIVTTSTVMLVNVWDGIEEEISSHENVIEVKPVSGYRGTKVLRVRHFCPLAEAFVNSAPPPTPFNVIEGKGEWSREDEEDFKLVREQLIRRGIKLVTKYVRRRELTPKQRMIFLRAVQEGYYDYPRRITLSELAEKLGVSKSYLSETLMKVESKILKEVARIIV